MRKRMKFANGMTIDLSGLSGGVSLMVEEGYKSTNVGKFKKFD